ncbi:MAG: helix-turn-helix domain-containing protein [Christensenellales bacterium]
MANPQKRPRESYDVEEREGIAGRLSHLRLDLLNNKIGAKTQQEIADELSRALGKSVSSATVSAWESGSRFPSIHETAALAELYGTTCDYLITGVQPENIDASRKYGLSDEALTALEDMNSFKGLIQKPWVDGISYDRYAIVDIVSLLMCIPKTTLFLEDLIRYQLLEEHCAFEQAKQAEILKSFKNDLDQNMEYQIHQALQRIDAQKIARQNGDIVIDLKQYARAMKSELYINWQALLTKLLQATKHLKNIRSQRCEPKYEVDLAAMSPDEKL